MTKANEPAYPYIYPADGEPYEIGLTKKEKLAMEIYAKAAAQDLTPAQLAIWAKDSLRAADVFFEQLNK